MKSVAVAMFLVALSGRLSVVNETGKLGGVWITSNEFVADWLDVPNNYSLYTIAIVALHS